MTEKARGVMPHEAAPKNWAPTWPVNLRFSDGLDIPGTYRMDTNPNDRPKCTGPITELTREEADRLLGRTAEDYYIPDLLVCSSVTPKPIGVHGCASLWLQPSMGQPPVCPSCGALLRPGTGDDLTSWPQGKTISEPPLPWADED